jgi:hypothetical protein
MSIIVDNIDIWKIIIIFLLNMIFKCRFDDKFEDPHITSRNFNIDLDYNEIVENMKVKITLIYDWLKVEELVIKANNCILHN